MIGNATTLGERIVLAARLAVAAHLSQTFMEQAEQCRQVKLSGAESDRITDDPSPVTGTGALRPESAPVARLFDLRNDDGEA